MNGNHLLYSSVVQIVTVSNLTILTMSGCFIFDLGLITLRIHLKEPYHAKKIQFPDFWNMSSLKALNLNRTALGDTVQL